MFSLLAGRVRPEIHVLMVGKADLLTFQAEPENLAFLHQRITIPEDYVAHPVTSQLKTDIKDITVGHVPQGAPLNQDIFNVRVLDARIRIVHVLGETD